VERSTGVGRLTRQKYPPAVANVLVHFQHENVDRQELAEDFRDLAYKLAERDPKHPLLPVTLQKLLEALDAAKRSARPMSTNQLDV